ncbi:MAG: S-layer homology domain-containing protein [Armatimonadetes bacterium]|nr:S-layer homology domain-containing protein [Armatimonadota bacterium]
MRRLCLALGLAWALFFPGLAAAAPLFPDLPESHWAKDAVRALAEKGLVEGYPDGTFKGDRSATRYEVAMIIARFLARMEQAHASFATKAELNELRKLVEAFREELDALGVRVTNLEETTGRLDQRVTELERIQYYGRMQFVGVSNNVRGASDDIGTVGNPGIDWSTGRLLVGGTGLTAAGTLGFNADLTEDHSGDLLAGGEFVAYSAQGDLGVDGYWGVSAPYLTNPWTGQPAGPGAVPQSENHFPFTRMVLDNFWVRHRPTDTRVTLGSYFPEHVGAFVINGARNPNIHRPRWLPFYGADVKGTIAGRESGWKYEAFYTQLPELTAYDTHSHGATVKYEFKEEKGHAAIHFARTQNERINDGALQALGLIPLPAVPFTGPGAPPVAPNSWMGIRDSEIPAAKPGVIVPLAQTVVGPQEENNWGLDFNYEIWEEPDLRLFVEFASSHYDPDRSDILYNSTASGDLWRAGLSAAPIEGLELSLQYLHVDPTYDPFIAAYPLPPNIPVFLPYGTYYSNYYQLHDYLEYPNNREGIKFDGGYTFNENNTNVHLSFQSLTQVKPTTPAQVQTVGNIEPLFSLLQAGGGQEGRVQSVGVGFWHRFDNGLRLSGDYYNYNLDRNAPAIDDISLVEDIYRLGLSYPVQEDLDLRASVYHLDYRGHNGVLNTDFTQTIPGVGLDFKLSRQTLLSLDYRFFDLDNQLVPEASWNGGQLLVEMKLDF